MPRVLRMKLGQTKTIRHGDLVEIVDDDGAMIAAYFVEFQSGSGRRANLIPVDPAAESGHDVTAGQPASRSGGQ